MSKYNQLSLFFKYYIFRWLSELGELVPLPYSRCVSTRYSSRLHDFCVTIPRCYDDIYVNSFFSRTFRLWNSLPAVCYPLTYDLNPMIENLWSNFTSSVIKHLLSLSSFWSAFVVCFSYMSSSFSFDSMPCIGCSFLYRVNPN